MRNLSEIFPIFAICQFVSKSIKGTQDLSMLLTTHLLLILRSQKTWNRTPRCFEDIMLRHNFYVSLTLHVA